MFIREKQEYEEVAITGCAGFIYSHLAYYLLDQGYRVLGIDNFSTGRREVVDALLNRPNFRFIEKGIGAVKREDIGGISAVFHGAALPRVPYSIKFPEKTSQTNIEGTLHLLKVAADVGIKKFIYASSSSVYGNQTTFPLTESLKPDPLSPYAVQKLVGEYYGKVFSSLYGMDFVALRYFNVYGPGQRDDSSYTGVITLFKKWKREGEPLTIFGDGEQTRDFTHVSDICRANLMASSINGCHIFNVAGSTETSLNRIADTIAGKTYPRIYKPARAGDPRRTRGDGTLFKNACGYTTLVEIEEGLKSF